MSTLVNGIIQIGKKYAIKNFMRPENPPVEVGELSFADYEAAVCHLSNLLYPESYRSYLLAVKDVNPNYDTWNNLMFIGHVNGYYDHDEKKFKSARQLGMNAANETEIAYVEALGATYASIKNMIKKKIR